MKVTVKFFSSLMEYLPADAADNAVDIVQAGPVSPNQVLERYKIPEAEVQTMMVNGVFLPPAKRDDPLSDGDTLTVWPALQGA